MIPQYPYVQKTNNQDNVLVEFFQAMLRMMPVHVKLLIGQDEQEIFDRQSDFCPSNRFLVEGPAGQEAAQILERSAWIPGWKRAVWGR